MSKIHITFNKDGGSGGKSHLYFNTSDSRFYSESALETVVTRVSEPSYYPYVFLGYFTGTVGGSKIVDSDGTILSSAAAICSGIGNDFTAYAHWNRSFGKLTDYFGVETHATNKNYLMLVSSESGTNRRVTNLWNGAFEQGDELANPVCTFKIKAAGNVSFVIGKAWSGANGKYMLSDVEYTTGSDKEPILVLKGTANEGVDSVTKKTVTFAVDPDHVSQDPFSAVSGGGELIECKSVVTCDPVVPYEDNKPCASDCVHFREIVTATTCAYNEESKPTASNSFIESGVPKSESDVDFTSYSFAAERSI